MKSREEVFKIVRNCMIAINIPGNEKTRNINTITEDTVFEDDLWFQDEEMFKLVLACEKALDKRFPWAVFDNQKTVGKLVDDLLEYLKLI